MDNKDRNFAKSHLSVALLECHGVGITPEEVADIVFNSEYNTLDTMSISSYKKKIANLFLLLKVVSQLLEVSTLILEKNGYNVETEKKTLDYVNKVLPIPRPPAPEPLVLIQERNKQ